MSEPTAFQVLQEASGHTDDDTRRILREIHERGFVLVPLSPPDETVGAVMSWIHYDDPQRAREAINRALFWTGIEAPKYVDLVRKLGAGDMSLPEYWTALRDRDRDGERCRPGSVLYEEFLIPYGLTIEALAKNLHVSVSAIMEILGGEPITADMALRLAKAFGTTPEFWLDLQTNHDLMMAMDQMPDDVSEL